MYNVTANHHNNMIQSTLIVSKIVDTSLVWSSFPGGWGDSHIKVLGMILGKFENNL